VSLEPLGVNSKVSIGLGLDPQLAVNDHAETINRLLLDLQIPFYLKDRIWEIVQAGRPRTVKIGGLLSLEIEEVFKGPLLELLLADSRS